MAFKRCGPDSVEFKMFQDYWKFFQEHYEIEGQDSDYWNNVLKDARALVEKWGNNKFVQDICIAYIDMLERTEKATRKKEQG